MYLHLYWLSQNTVFVNWDEARNPSYKLENKTITEPISEYSSHILGGIAALGSALLWAISAILFKKIGNNMQPIAMNFTKGIVAILCLTVLIIPSDLLSLDKTSLMMLAISGIIGISLGDTFYFATLVRMGPRITLLIGTLIPVCVAIISVLFLHEKITSIAWIGITLTIAGVATVLWEQSPHTEAPKHIGRGVIFALIFILANALGIILTKLGVANIPTLEATLIRESAAVMGLAVWGAMSHSLLKWVKPLKNLQLLGWLTFAAIIGTFLGTWLSVIALKYTYTSVAATLNSTSPIFILPLIAFFLKEHVSLKATAGALMAVGGIALYFFTL